MTIKELLEKAHHQLKMHSATATLDAALLLCFSLQVTREYLFAHREKIISLEQQQDFFHLLKRRLMGEPMAYILSQKEFWNISLTVSPDTLIPRPETELLVELALKYLPEYEEMRVADLGTGTGAIALALAKARPRWKIIATDCSERALQIAQDNAKRLQLLQIDFYQGDWCEALPGAVRCHAIISNPPYLASDDIHLSQGDLRFEPRLALVSGTDGLDAIRKIASKARDYLVPAGLLLLEHGYRQALAVKNLLQKEHFHAITTHSDLAGLDRATICKI